MIEIPKEPWAFHEQGDADEYCLLTSEGKWVIGFRQNGEFMVEKQRAIARRIVACVNAFAGVSIENVENNRPVAWLAKQYNKAMRERDEFAARVESTSSLMSALLDELGERDKGDGNAPGHCHETPGVWDGDNGALAGKSCAWCATWAHAKATRDVCAPPSAASEVIAERRRQQAVEGWTPENDDQHSAGELADAAACYAANAAGISWSGALPSFWPWAPKWWKPTTPRRDLVKAAALILAEIERIDRKEGIKESLHA